MGTVWQDIGSILDLGTGAYGGIFEGTQDFLSDPTGKHSQMDALKSQEAAIARADDIALQSYYEQQGYLAPYQGMGEVSMRNLYQGMPELTRSFSQSDFQTDPGYQFRISEGQKAIERAAAAGGRSTADPRTMKEMSRWSQDYASGEYQNAFNRFTSNQDRKYDKMSDMAGLGYSTARDLAGYAGNYGNRVGENAVGMGNAQAAYHNSRAAFNQGVTNQGMQMGSSMLGMAFCDERLKINIEEITKEDIAELRACIKPYMFNYANDIYGEGEWIGPMAQDLEKSKLGAWLVDHDELGNKQIDMKKVGCLILATMGEE